jgi:hypothetical protein
MIVYDFVLTSSQEPSFHIWNFTRRKKKQRTRDIITLLKNAEWQGWDGVQLSHWVTARVEKNDSLSDKEAETLQFSRFSVRVFVDLTVLSRLRVGFGRDRWDKCCKVHKGQYLQLRHPPPAFPQCPASIVLLLICCANSLYLWCYWEHHW